MKDGSFAKVVGGTYPIHNKGRNGVAAKPAGGRGMEFFCIFVALKGKPHFGSSPPI
jgi:hypothetical protein